MDSLKELFCHIDDFCQQFEPKWHGMLLGEGAKHRQRQRSLSLSEIMTILVYFHQQHCRNFKAFSVLLQHFGTPAVKVTNGDQFGEPLFFHQ